MGIAGAASLLNLDDTLRPFVWRSVAPSYSFKTSSGVSAVP